MSTKAPKINKKGLSAFLAQKSPEIDFLDAFYFRTLSLLVEMEAGNIGREVVAFESIFSAFSFLEDGRTHEDLKNAYPVKAWREDTITVPKAWLRVIAEGWMKYRKAPSGSTIGEVFNLEGGGQGKQPLRAVIERQNRETRLSNRVMVAWLAGNLEGKMSQSAAIAEVAEQECLSVETVKNAWRARKSQKLERLTALGVLDP